MNKRILFLVSIISIVIVAAIIYVVIAKKEDASNTATTETTTQTADKDSQSQPVAITDTPAEAVQTKRTQPTPAQTVATRDGNYTDYSSTAIASTTGTKLLFFHAPWCSQCRAMEKSINDGGIPTGVTVIKVDYDSNQSLRQKYGVTLQTTFVKVDDAGNKIDSYVSYEEPQFSSVERELL